MSKPGIPSWQRAASLPGTEETTSRTESTPVTNEAMLHANQEVDESDTVTMKERTLKFLRDPVVQGQPREKKLAFLESKGLRREDVEPILQEYEQQQNIQEPQATSFQQSPQTFPATTATIASAREVPPIITYPEFLLQETKRPPLVTKKFLVNTAYAASGIAASMYAISKWIIEPMEEALTEARHDFLTHTDRQLYSLNEKMKGMASKLPEETHKHTGSRPGTSSGYHSDAKSQAGDEDDDADSIRSDPTELYHLDKGTQTSPPRSRRTSVSSDPSSPSNEPHLPPSLVDRQETSLKQIHGNLNTLQSSATGREAGENDMATQLHELTRYLSEMRYSSPYFGYKPPTIVGGGVDAISPAAKEQDEIERVRAEIRGIKGVLLSTRNVPRGGGYR